MREWCQLNNVADLNPETLPTNTDSDFSFRYIHLGAVDRGTIEWDFTTITKFGDAPSRARRIARQGDTLFGTVRPNLQSHGYIERKSTGATVASTGFCVVRPYQSRVLGRYLFHSLMSDSVYRQSIRAAIGSNYPAITDRDLQTFELFFPPLDEQHQIANILDTLDTQIRRTEQVIAKLEQVKQGLLTDLLTRGIDENGELRPPPNEAPHLYKDSPLGWLPKKWQVRRLGECCAGIVDCPHSTPNYRDDGVLVARTTNIKAGVFLEENASRVSEAEYSERVVRMEPQKGDVIFTREAPVGEAFVIPDGMRICLGQRVMLLRPKHDYLNGQYLVAQIYGGLLREKVQALTAGTTNPHLNVAEVANFQIPVPPVLEQNVIDSRQNSLLERLRRERQNIDKAVAVKSGLMDDLLSGRVRVTHLLSEAEQAAS